MTKLKRCWIVPGLGALWLTLPAQAAELPKKLAVLPVQVDTSAEKDVPDLFNEVVLTAVHDATQDEVIGADDINALISFEQSKDIFGCEDTSCLADIGGALGVDRLVVFKVARVATEWVITSKIMNIRTAQVEARSSDFVSGDIKALIRAMPDVVGRLFGRRGPSGARAPTSQPPPPQRAAPPPPAAPATGSLTIVTKPSGVACVLNGSKLGKSPCRAKDMPVGRYELELSKDYYTSRKVVVYVYKSVDTKLSYDLTPKPVKLQVKTKPAGAAVLIDGDEAPPDLALDPGRYELVARLHDHADAVQVVDVRPGPPMSLNFTLKPGLSGAQLSSWRARLAWGIVFGVVAAGAGGVWAWSGLEAQGARERMLSSIPGGSSRQSSFNWGTTTATIADASIVATAVSTALASGLLISLAF